MSYPREDNRPQRGNFDRGSFGNNRPGRRPEFHKAICDSCKKECEIPFKPTGERPVYCRDCFAKNGGPERRDNFNRDNKGSRDFQRPAFSNAPQAVRFQPQPQPVHQHSTQLADISAKLDQVIKLLTIANEAAHPQKSKIVPQEEILVIEEKVPEEKAVKSVEKKKTVKKATKKKSPKSDK